LYFDFDWTAADNLAEAVGGFLHAWQEADKRKSIRPRGRIASTAISVAGQSPLLANAGGVRMWRALAESNGRESTWLIRTRGAGQ